MGSNELRSAARNSVNEIRQGARDAKKATTGNVYIPYNPTGNVYVPYNPTGEGAHLYAASENFYDMPIELEYSVANNASPKVFFTITDTSYFFKSQVICTVIHLCFKNGACISSDN